MSNKGKQPRPRVDMSSSDGESYPTENKLTLQSINHRMSINSAMSSNYATQWGPVEAFRELIQNWKDGIIQSFKLPEQDFRVVREEGNSEIIYKATAPGSSKECFGYIRWSRLGKTGIVEITNRQATLEPWHLDMGGTSKKNERNQAGTHGEGLKIALLILMRDPQNHAVRCRSGGFSWTFDFTNQRRLITCPVRMSPAEIAKTRDQAKDEVNKSLLPFVPAPNEDVQFIIGTNSRGRDENGWPTKRGDVNRKEFKNWMKAAIFLQDIAAEGIVKTRVGDLILDPRYGGNIYLKGLLLKESKEGRSASITAKKLKYGYNFATGATNRERESVASADDESRAILSIWNEALITKEDLVGKLHELLNSKDTEYADVASAEMFIRRETRDRLKTFLLNDYKGKWLYSGKEKSQNPRFDHIVQGLGLEPLELKDCYWDIMKKAGFRTAEEEEKKRFEAAELLPIPEDLFSTEIVRLTRAALEICSQTAIATVVFVKAGNLGLDSLYSPTGVFKIHEKWSTLSGAKIELDISRASWMSVVLLSASKRLLIDAFSQVPLHLLRGDSQFPPHWNQKRAISESDQRILELVQIKRETQFSVKVCDKSSLMEIKWNPSTAWSQQCKVTIQIHRETTCSRLKDLLVAEKVANADTHRCTTTALHAHLPLTTCFATTVPFETEVLRVRVQKGQNYFVMMFNQSDPGSLVVLRERPLIITGNVADSSADVFDKGVPKMEGVETYTLGDCAESLDIMTPRDWFHSSGSNGSKAVIGVEKVKTVNKKLTNPQLPPKPQRTESPPTSKRRSHTPRSQAPFKRPRVDGRASATGNIPF
ncbi:hypothetical protein F5Y05DRAFT_407479 [Hypoxylon sp. FL0543]|nr:hypothetical protein F5Y05DRAFT_407479 [Hypoxylon sp. FL0543]